MIRVVRILAVLPFCCWNCSSLLLPSIKSSPRLRTTPSLPRLYSDIAHADDTGFGSQTFYERYESHLPNWLIEKCADNGWEYPTDVQERTLDAILKENTTDVVVQAQTGSGKTLAFLIPCLAAIDPTRSAVQALIVVPTRELGLQVAKVAKRLATGPEKIMVMSVLQGSQNRRQRAWAWAEPPHVVIGTPEELCNMIRYGGIKRYNSIKYLVVDEVDACLLNNGGKILSKLILSSGTPLHELLSKYLSPTYDDGQDDSDFESNTVVIDTNKPRPVQNERHTIFCSATIPQIRHFLKQCVQNQWMLQAPRHISVRPGDLPSRIRHGFVVCSETAAKLQALRRIIRKIDMSTTDDQSDQNYTSRNLPKKILVFAESHRPLEEMAKVIAKDVTGGLYWNEQTADVSDVTSIRVSVLRYEDSLSQRAIALDGFREGSNGAIMLSTDLAARGLDVPDISHVVQFDLANTPDTYVHRSGRTGRLGKSGQVINILTPDEEFVLQRLANALQLDLSCIGRHSTAARNTKKNRGN